MPTTPLFDRLAGTGTSRRRIRLADGHLMTVAIDVDGPEPEVEVFLWPGLHGPAAWDHLLDAFHEEAQHAELYPAVPAAEVREFILSHGGEHTNQCEVECPSSGAVVIIPCARRQLDTPAPAGELYAPGSYHRASRRAAEAIVSEGGGTVLVLSGRHGLLPLDRVLSPYDQRLGRPGCVLPEQLREQARELGVADAPKVIVLAGRQYAAAAREVWPDCVWPLVGLGIGHQQREFVVLAEGRPNGHPRGRCPDAVNPCR